MPTSDAENRNRITTDLETNILVEAAAGTGKTTCIVERMVRLIATGSCQIDQLVALTFTRKAAAELRERFHARMREVASAGSSGESAGSEADTWPPIESERIASAVHRMDHAFVGTFHSFCSMLLRERPVEFEVSPDFRELDEEENEQLQEQAWDTFLNSLYASADERVERIVELGLKTTDLRDCFARLIDFPDIDEWPHQPVQPLDLDWAKRQTEDFVAEMRELLPHFPRERNTDQVMNRYEEIVLASENTDWSLMGQFFELLQLFDTSRKPVLKHWHDPDVARQQRTRWADFRTTVVQPALSWWCQYRYRFVMDLLTDAVHVYGQMAAASGGLDFQDLLLYSTRALQTQPLLRSYFQRRFTHFLVDEFQDTDPVQAEMLAYLTSENHDETRWRHCCPRAGALFLVGDPKQSIYRFRRADIVVYQQLKELIEATGGSTVTLSTNYRSVASVRLWVNDVFRGLLPAEATRYAPAAVDMEHGRDDALSGELEGVWTLSVPGNVNRSEAVADEATRIAQFIAHAISSEMTVPRTESEQKRGRTARVEPSDFLIVTRFKRYLPVYAHELDRLGIDNEVHGSNAFESIDELRTLLDCLKAVDDPRNPIPYVALLRSSLFGFGDADLYEIRRLGGTLAYTRALPTGLADDLHRRYEDVNDRLSCYRRWLRNRPFVSAVAAIARDLGLIASCSSREGGHIVAGGFLKAIEWLRSEAASFDSATDVISYLEQMLDSPETDTCSVKAAPASCVRIMNLHKAKGLEAPVVILANTFGVFRRPPTYHVDRQGDVTRGYLAITQRKEYGHYRPIAVPHDWETLQREEQQFEDAEQTRLLYVACTRAQCQLIVSVADEDKRSPSFWSPLQNHLAGAEELPAPMVAQEDPVLPVAPAISLNDLELRTREAWVEIRRPSYAVLAAKEQAIGDRRPSWRATGNYGHQWGSAVHRLLELLIKHESLDLDAAARQLLTEFELGSDRRDELVQTAEAVSRSDIWLRARVSSQLHTEIPYEFPTTGAVPTIERGVIDLCFLENDGWVIVDYKTDDISASDVKDATAFYAPQINSYSQFWQAATGQTVHEAGLYFTRHDRFCSVSE